VCPAGNLSAAAAFAVAFLGDVLDVAAHVVVVTGLMHTHFQVRHERGVGDEYRVVMIQLGVAVKGWSVRVPSHHTTK
jgi:hypothetical protein